MIRSAFQFRSIQPMSATASVKYISVVLVPWTKLFLQQTDNPVVVLGLGDYGGLSDQYGLFSQ